MTVQELGKILLCNTPDFEYHGKWHTIDWMDGQFPDIKLYFIPFNCGVGACDGTGDGYRLFHGLDDLLDNCIIEGKSLREILPEIEM